MRQLPCHKWLLLHGGVHVNPQMEWCIYCGTLRFWSKLKNQRLNVYYRVSDPFLADKLDLKFEDLPQNMVEPPCAVIGEIEEAFKPEAYELSVDELQSWLADFEQTPVSPDLGTS